MSYFNNDDLDNKDRGNSSDPFNSEAMLEELRKQPGYYSDMIHPHSMTEEQLAIWGRMHDREIQERRELILKRQSEEIAANRVYRMPDDKAKLLIEYARTCMTAIGYDSDRVLRDLPDNFIALDSGHHVIRERVENDGTLTLVFEENYYAHDLLTDEVTDESEIIDEQPVTETGIRKIVMCACKRLAEINLESAAETVMDRLSGVDNSRKARREAAEKACNDDIESF